jgi:GntR family transcriptional regulator / MocR family aminotransferase
VELLSYADAGHAPQVVHDKLIVRARELAGGSKPVKNVETANTSMLRFATDLSKQTSTAINVAVVLLNGCRISVCACVIAIYGVPENARAHPIHLHLFTYKTLPSTWHVQHWSQPIGKELALPYLIFMQLLISLSPDSNTPLYRQVANRIKELILTGQLAQGSQLPSSRELAETLAVSRITINQAYTTLMDAGFIETQPARGTFVKVEALKQPLPKSAVQSFPLELSTYGERILKPGEIEAANLELFPELNYSAAAVEQLPLSTWRETLLATTRKRNLSTRSYITDEFGHIGLRTAIRGYLSRARGIDVSTEQIAIFAGTQPALDLVCRVLLNADDKIVVEDPGFPGARRTFKSHGVKVVPIAVDDEGLQTHRLPTDPDIKAAFVTPSHQDPTGAVLSEKRRGHLLHWAKENKVLLIEDDFDCEFNFAKGRSPALKSLDRNELVVYLSGFWKVLFPIVRVGIAVIPHPLLPVMRTAKSLIERDFQFVEHEALAAFIEQGYLEKHIRRLNTVYARKRLKLLGSLHKHCKNLLKISAVTTGTHILVRFPRHLKEEDIKQIARESRLNLVSMSPYQMLAPTEVAFLVPFSHLNENELDSVVSHFARAIKELL